MLENLRKKKIEVVGFLSSVFDGKSVERNHICGISQLIFNYIYMSRNYSFRARNSRLCGISCLIWGFCILVCVEKPWEEENRNRLGFFPQILMVKEWRETLYLWISPLIYYITPCTY